MSVAIEDAGFITHPLIAWVFGSGFPKATRIKAEGYDGFRYGGQALKPAIEPIYMGQKPFEKGLTGALNVDGCRISTGDDLNGGAYAAVGGRGVSSSLHAGSGMNQPGKTTGKVYEQPAGRWPANLILSYPEDEYQLDPFATPEQRKEVWRWFYENA
jgi:site-specific DNA-methyltransferase (adenine-specific)